MKLQQPLMALSLVLPVAILILYLLRRKYLPKQVPSTFLWRKALRDTAADHPFQKWKKNLLMFLQLAAALALCLALMRPALPGGQAGKTVLIVDVSGSMRAADAGQTRLDLALRRAETLVESLPAGEKITVLTAGEEVRQLALHAGSREALRALRSIRGEDGGASMEEALSLARAIRREEGEQGAGAAIVVFSDTFVPETGVAAVNVGRGQDNRTVYALTAEENSAFARVANFGQACTLSLLCEVDGTLREARELSLAEGASEGVAFSLPDQAREVTVRIREADAIAADNTLTVSVRRRADTTVAVTGDSLFLESALKVRPGLTVLRMAEEALETTQADLYILGEGPTVWTTHPLQSVFSWPEEAVTPQGTLVLAGNTPLTHGLTLKDVSLRKAYPLTGGRAAVLAGQDPVIAFAEGEVAVGFDLHDSNLPLKYDFPLLTQYILAYLLPEADADAQSGVSAPGNHPLEESDVRLVAPSVAAGDETAAGDRHTDVTDVFLLLFLVLQLVEWGVSRYVG